LTYPLPVRASSSFAPKDAPPPPVTMPAGGSGSQQHTSAGNVAVDPSAATAASSAPASSTPPATAEEVPVAFAPTMPGDTGAEVAPSVPQDPPATVEAMPSGSQVPAGGPEAAVPPTATADPTVAMSSNIPSMVGVGARPAPSHRQLRRNRRLFLGDRSSLASSQEQRRLPSLRCCPAFIRLSRRPRR
jgi:hypothetical protein